VCLSLCLDVHNWLHYFRPPKSTLDDDDDHDCNSDDEAAASPAVRYAFPELDSQIRVTIEEYGGAVFPKLNFSSPKVRCCLSVWGGALL
jgi:hypothetical protein